MAALRSSRPPSAGARRLAAALALSASPVPPLDRRAPLRLLGAGPSRAAAWATQRRAAASSLPCLPTLSAALPATAARSAAVQESSSKTSSTSAAPAHRRELAHARRLHRSASRRSLSCRSTGPKAASAAAASTGQARRAPHHLSLALAVTMFGSVILKAVWLLVVRVSPGAAAGPSR